MARCLILGCTQAKRDDERPLPALERYDGPVFRVVRRFLRDAAPPLRDVNVYVLSARYGLISANQRIADYDRRMTPARAAELRPGVLSRLREILSDEYDEVFLSLSQAYMQALNGFEALVPVRTQVTISQTTMGRRLAELKRWLYRLPEEAVSERLKRTTRVTGRATLRGREIEATSDEVLLLARRALQEERGDPHNFRSWYAVVDGEKVGTKWLVSLLSGLDVSEFQTSEARRVLGQLGVAAYHYE